MSGPTLLLPGNLEATDYSPPQEQLDKLRPIDYIMDRFAQCVGREGQSIADRIFVIQSSTGSGKSTIFPPETFHRFFKETRKSICCTQPRVLTSVEIPNTILPFHTKEALSKAGLSARTPLEMGFNIGYQTGVITKKPVRGIIYMTVGVLMQQLNTMSHEDFMKKYSFIYIDEAHERSIGTDFVLAAMKKFIHLHYRHKECPFLIVMSATFDPTKFCDYLFSPLLASEKNSAGGAKKDASIDKPERYKNIIKVRGTSFPIAENFLEYDSTNYLQAAVERVVAIHTEHPEDFLASAVKPEKKVRQLKEDAQKEVDKKQRFRDILIFVGGISEIRKVKQQLNRLNAQHKFFREYPILPLELSGDVVQAQSHEYKQIFEEYSKLRVTVEGGEEWQEAIEENSATSEDMADMGMIEGGGEDKDTCLELTEGGFEKRGFGHNHKTRTQIKKPVRRVIVATNVAETGITIDSLGYVIDSGWHKSSEFDPVFAADMLITKPVTQGMYRQRRGRVGRKAPGTCYALYTQDTFTHLQADQYPEIMKNDISLDLLGLIIRKLDDEGSTLEKSLQELRELRAKEGPQSKSLPQGPWDVFHLDLLDLPSADSLHHAMEKLYVLGAIDADSQPTLLGVVMSKMRFLPIERVKMIFAAYAWEISVSDLITIAACLDQGMHKVVAKEGMPLYRAAQSQGMFTLFPQVDLPTYAKAKTELLMADDFLQYLLIFYEWQKETLRVSQLQIGEEVPNEPAEEEEKEDKKKEKKKEKKKKSATQFARLQATFAQQMQEWCARYGVNYAAMVNIIEAREDIIANLASLGFDPYQHFAHSIYTVIPSGDDTTKLRYLRALKQCLFEGYKLNIAVWNPTEKAYRSRKSHLALQIDSPFVQSRGEILKYGDSNPRYILYDRVFFRQNPQENTYEPEEGHISVLDGFCTLDANFDAIL